MINTIIFDMDGVISDTQKLHSKIETELLGRYGIKISAEEITKKYSGVRTKDFFDNLLKQQNLKYNLDELIKEKRTKMEKLAAISIDEIPGSGQLIQTLDKLNYKLAVASASNLNYVKNVLKTLNIIQYFNVIISGDMVSKGKPDPESFLLAASKLDSKPEECIVIEDGISGMQAAKTANMKCIGLVSDTNLEYPTENLVTSMSQITIDYINQVK